MPCTPNARRRLVILVVTLGLPLTVLGAFALFLYGDGPARRLAEGWAERFPGQLQVTDLRLAATDAVAVHTLHLSDDTGRQILVLDEVTMHGSWRDLRLHGARIASGQLRVDNAAVDFWRRLLTGLEKPPLDLILPPAAPDEPPPRDGSIQIEAVDLLGPHDRQARIALRVDREGDGRHWFVQGSGDYGRGELIIRDRPGASSPDLLRWTLLDVDPQLTRDLLHQVIGHSLPAILDEAWPAWSSSGMISRDDGVERLVLVATCEHPLLPQRIDLRGALAPTWAVEATLHWPHGATTKLGLSRPDQTRWRIAVAEGSLPWAVAQAWATAHLPKLGSQLHGLPLTPMLRLAGTWAEGAGSQWQGQLAVQATIGVTVQADSTWHLDDTGLHVSDLHLDSPLLRLGPATGSWNADAGTLHWPSWTLKTPGALWLGAATGLNLTGLSTLTPHGSLSWTMADARLSLTAHGDDEARWHVAGGGGSGHQGWSLHARQLPIRMIANHRFGPVTGTIAELRGQWAPTGRSWSWEATLRDVGLSPAAGEYQVAQAKLKRSQDQAWHWSDAQLQLARPPGDDDPALIVDITDLAAATAAVADSWQLPALRGRLRGTLVLSRDGSLRPVDLEAEALGSGAWLEGASARLTTVADDPGAITIALNNGHLLLGDGQVAIDSLLLRWHDHHISGQGQLAGGSPLRLSATPHSGRWQVQAVIDPIRAADLPALMPDPDLATEAAWAWPLAGQLLGDDGWQITPRASWHRPLICGLPWTMADFMEAPQ